jgi:hypothetical protein
MTLRGRPAKAYHAAASYVLVPLRPLRRFEGQRVIAPS